MISVKLILHEGVTQAGLFRYVAAVHLDDLGAFIQFFVAGLAKSDIPREISFNATEARALAAALNEAADLAAEMPERCPDCGEPTGLPDILCLECELNLIQPRRTNHPDERSTP